MSLLYALMMQYQADIEKAKANINVYLENPAGIGEHADLVSALLPFLFITTGSDTIKRLYINMRERNRWYVGIVTKL